MHGLRSKLGPGQGLRIQTPQQTQVPLLYVIVNDFNQFQRGARGQEVRSQKSVHSDQGFDFGPWSDLNEYNGMLSWPPPGQELRNQKVQSIHRIH